MRKLLRFLLLLFLPLTLFSCSDKQGSSLSCAIQLDNQKNSKVATNIDCTNYERGSAYLGLAGVSFGNFLKTGATDNLTNTLGISPLSSAVKFRRHLGICQICTVDDSLTKLK